MTMDDMRANTNNASFDSMLCQTEIKTDEDKARCEKLHYDFLVKSSEIEEKLKIDPSNVFYFPGEGCCIYFNKTSLAACPLRVLYLLTDAFNDRLDEPFPVSFSKLVAKRESQVANHDYFDSSSAFPDAVRFDYLNLVVKKEGGAFPGLYQLFLDTYLNADFGFERIEPDVREKILESKTPEEICATKEKLAGLPETFTVYRGGSSVSLPYTEAYSWTLDINVANFFAVRKHKGPGYIAIGEVNKEDVIEYLSDDRNEEEILVPPSMVKVTQVITLHDKGIVEHLAPTTIQFFGSYCDKLNRLKFACRSNFHDRKHEERVLLLSLMLAEQLDLSMADREILATASIYHDTQRKNDGNDSKHGLKAKKHYHSSSTKPDPLVEFLCHYHCLPDVKGYFEIKNNPQLNADIQRVTTLINAFKDADALDRVRLGRVDKCLDMNQLRCDISKQLTLVASIICDSWEAYKTMLMDCYKNLPED